MKKPRQMTIEQFKRKHGDAKRAALACGVHPSTFGHWLAGESVPRGNNARRLRDLGVRA